MRSNTWKLDIPCSIVGHFVLFFKRGKVVLGIEHIPNDVEVLNYNVELRPKSFGARQTIFSAYVEDAYHVDSRLLLTLGLRYDYDNLSKGGGSKGDDNNLAPRFSFNYQLNSSSALRGGYGFFYDKILYAIYSDALQQNTTSPDYRKQLQALIDQGVLPADTDLNGDGRSFGEAYVGNSDRHPGEARNSDRLPWSNTFDLAAEYQWPLAKGRLILRADVFNLLNAVNWSGYSNNATQSNQMQVGARSSGLLVRRNAAPPRQVQFSLRYSF